VDPGYRAPLTIAACKARGSRAAGLRRVLHTRRGRFDSDAPHDLSRASSREEHPLDRRRIGVQSPNWGSWVPA